MSDTICIEIPREVAKSARLTSMGIKLELAISLFQQKRISFGKACELSQISAWKFQHILGLRGLSLHYDVEDYEHDVDTLKGLGRL